MKPVAHSRSILFLTLSTYLENKRERDGIIFMNIMNKFDVEGKCCHLTKRKNTSSCSFSRTHSFKISLLTCCKCKQLQAWTIFVAEIHTWHNVGSLFLWLSLMWEPDNYQQNGRNIRYLLKSWSWKWKKDVIIKFHIFWYLLKHFLSS